MKINKKNIRYSIDDHHHGLYVKEARLRHGYRLSEVAEEICDASYLSKIESGRIIPNIEVFEKIVARLKIQFPTKKHQCPVDLFKKALYQEDVDAILPYLNHDAFHHYEMRMLEFFRYVEKEELEKATEIKNEIDQFQFHFHSKEEQAYLLFAGLYYLKTSNWEKGKAHLENSYKLMVENEEEDPYLCLQLAKYYFRVNKACVGFVWLERAATEFKRLFEQKWSFKCDMIWCKEMLENGDVNTVEAKMKEWKILLSTSSDSEQRQRLNNVWALFYEKREDYDLAEKHFLESIEEKGVLIQEICLIDAISFYYRRQRKKELIKLVDGLNLSELKPENRALIDFYYLKFTDEESEFFEIFLKKDAIPMAEERFDYPKMTLFTKELTKLYRRKFSYKKLTDAYHGLEKFCEALVLAGET